MITEFPEITHIKINLKKISDKNKLTKEETKKLKEQGFHNGKVYNIIQYTAIGTEFVIDCEQRGFFDFMVGAKDINIINVNAIIYAYDKNNNQYILLIKREEEVYDYPNCWDLPAGFAVCPQTLFDRLYNRIYKDTGLKQSSLIHHKGIWIYPKKKTTGVYYKFESRRSYEDLIRYLHNDIRNKRITLIPISKIKAFMKKNKCYEAIKYIKPLR